MAFEKGIRMSLLDAIRLRNYDAIRAWLYVSAPVVLLAFGIDSVWVQLVTAVLAPTLMAVNSVDGFRTWLYGVLAAVQAVLLFLGVATEIDVNTWVPVILSVLGGGVGASNVKAGKHASAS